MFSENEAQFLELFIIGASAHKHTHTKHATQTASKPSADTHLDVEVDMRQGVQKLAKRGLEELVVVGRLDVLRVARPDGLVVVLHAPRPHVLVLGFSDGLDRLGLLAGLLGLGVGGLLLALGRLLVDDLLMLGLLF
jgi:hypothetical protein